MKTDLISRRSFLSVVGAVGAAAVTISPCTALTAITLPLISLFTVSLFDTAVEDTAKAVSVSAAILPMPFFITSLKAESSYP